MDLLAHEEFPELALGPGVNGLDVAEMDGVAGSQDFVPPFRIA
jgi:hypothetical protein